MSQPPSFSRFHITCFSLLLSWTLGRSVRVSMQVKWSDKCSYQSKTWNQLEKHHTDVHESIKIICNKCNLSCNSKNELNTHIIDKHFSYKPCIKFGAGNCDTVKCRFSHRKLSGNQEVCYKCGHISLSKTENINHIKSLHGHEICFKFL